MGTSTSLFIQFSSLLGVALASDTKIRRSARPELTNFKQWRVKLVLKVVGRLGLLI
jgi:hypothetical protein